jgi:alanyl-tRNA synthetase
MVVHIGQVTRGKPCIGDEALARVDAQRRIDIMRNHTATHLLHHELRTILGEHARQAGSLVAPDRLRFDFTHPEAVTAKQLELIETGVNRNILGDYHLQIAFKPLTQAIEEGATALFGEKYGEIVRNITIGVPEPFSNELCGGTHVDNTSDIGLFLILSEGSTSAGVRRIEAVTGRAAYELVQRHNRSLKRAANLLTVSMDEVPQKVDDLLEELNSSRKQIAGLRRDLAAIEFATKLLNVPAVAGIPVLTAILPDADADTLRLMTDKFRQSYPNGIAVLASVQDGRPVVIAAVSEDLVKRGLNAGELVKYVAAPLGGGGGGKPTIAQAGGKDASKLEDALQAVFTWVQDKLGH